MSLASQHLFAPALNWINSALAWVYPEVCQVCRNSRANHQQGYVCDACREGVQWIQPPFCEKCGLPFEGAITSTFICTNCYEAGLSFTYARAAAAATGPVLEAIHGFKYRGGLWFEQFLAELLTKRAVTELSPCTCDVLVPVPLHSTKLRERGFNQAERLARALSKATGIPFCSDLLKRVTPTRTQTLLSRAERHENVRRAFTVPDQDRTTGLRVALVDDVLTTGATTNACTAALLSAGAGSVCVWTVARGV